MKKQILSFLFVTACAITSQSYGMQADKNHYFIYNNTPDATIVVGGGTAIAPNVKAAQLKNSASDHIEIRMPNNMRMAFHAPGHHSIALTKLVDANEPNKLAYRLAVLNLLTAQVMINQTLTPVAAHHAPHQGADQ